MIPPCWECGIGKVQAEPIEPGCTGLRCLDCGATMALGVPRSKAGWAAYARYEGAASGSFPWLEVVLSAPVILAFLLWDGVKRIAGKVEGADI